MARGFRIASRVGLVLALVQTLAAGLAAQVAPPVLTLDLESAVVTGRIPFDEQFDLRGNAPKQLVEVTLVIRPPREGCGPASPFATAAAGNSATWTRSDDRVVFSLTLGPIDAGRQYTLCVQTVTRQTDTANARIQREAATRVAEAVRSLFWSGPDTATPRSYVPEAFRDSLIAALLRFYAPYRVGTTHPYVPYDMAQLRGWFMAGPGRDADSLYHVLRQAYMNEAPRDFREDATRLETSLQQLRDSLSAARLDMIQPRSLQDREAEAVVRSVPRCENGPIYQIAFGARPLTALNQESPEPPIDRRGVWATRIAARLDTVGARFDTMQLQLWSLKELASRAPLSQAKSWVDQAVDSALAALSQLIPHARYLARAARATDEAVAGLVPPISMFNIDQVDLLGSTSLTYTERSKSYLMADVGLLGAPGWLSKFAGGAVQPYVGVNFNFMPVNRDARYGLFCLSRLGHWMRKCMSFTVGLTTGSIARPNVRTDLFGTHSLFIGLGLRVTSFASFTTGSLIFNSYRNDSGHAQRITGTLAFALTVAWDIKSTLGGLGDILGVK